MVRETITVDWPPRNNAAAILTNLGRWLVKVGFWLHGHDVVLQHRPTEPDELPTPEWGGGTQIAATLPPPPVQRSWLSEFWRKWTNNPKIPEVIQCQRLETRRILVIGSNGLIELRVNQSGVAQIVISNGVDIANARTITRKPTGEINDDWIGPDKDAAGAIDMAPDGTVFNRLPPPKEEPTDPAPPPTPEVH